jgi:hypothetical protein
MAKLTQKEHAELSACISAFPTSGKMFTDITKGRDFKAFAVSSLRAGSLSPSEKEVWLALSKVCAFTHFMLIFTTPLYVFRMAYCRNFNPEKMVPKTIFRVWSSPKRINIYMNTAYGKLIYFSLYLIHCRIIV